MDLHQEDLDFLDTLKNATKNELDVLLRFQACEAWRREAIEREIRRRILGTIPGSSNGRTVGSEPANWGSNP